MSQAARIWAALGVAGLLTLLSGGLVLAQGTPAFLRKPDIHGDRVVFTAEGDLWIGSVLSGTAQRLTSHPGLESFARFSPDGTEIAFQASYEGGRDVYVMPIAGGVPKRLTFDTQQARPLGWTPDGKFILFRSRKASPENKNRLWKVPVTGGLPELVPAPSVEHAVMTADGESMIYVPVSSEWQNWWRYEGGQADDLWLANLATKKFERLTNHDGVETTPVLIVDDVYYVAEYGETANLYRMSLRDRKPVRVTSYSDAAVRYPETDGRRIVFEHGNGLGLYDPATRRAISLRLSLQSDRIHARPRRIPVTSGLTGVHIGPTGKRVALESRGQIVTVPAEKGEVRTVFASPGVRAKYPAWSPDGKQIAFIADGSGEERLWITPADGSAAPRRLDFDHTGPLDFPVWSPDGKKIAVTDREARVLLVAVEDGKATLVDQGGFVGTYDTTNTSVRFSPDSKWLAFVRYEPNWSQSVYLYEITTTKKTRVAGPDRNAFAPAFDSSGKFLAFLADTAFTPRDQLVGLFGVDKTTRVYLLPLSVETASPFLEPSDEEGMASVKEPEKPKDGSAPETKVDLEGLAERAIEVPVPAGRYQQVEAIEGRLLLFGQADLPDGGQAGRLTAFDIKKKQSTTLMDRLTDLQLSADRKKILVRSGSSLSIVDSSTGPISGGAVDLSGALIEVDPPSEWKQIFAEAWRIARDFFYDPNLHGADWAVVRKKYEPMLAGVGSRQDLNELLAAVIAELNCGHAYVIGGDTGGTATSPLQMGHLAADLEPDPGGGAFKVVKVYQGDGFEASTRSPLAEPGINVKAGDFILAIDGVPVTTSRDIQAQLIGKAGKLVALLVNSKPSRDGARTVRIRPLAFDGSARYVDWVASRRKYVTDRLGPDAGYVHIPNMGIDGLAAFLRQYYQQLDKTSMVFDVRDNGGGYISGMLLAQIASKPVSWSKPRYGGAWTRQSWGFRGHSVALCNEDSGSDAEWFSDMFGRLKLGLVIGARTWGGLVGSGGGYRLLDGGALFIPNYGAFMDGKWIVEGPGFKPDIEVLQEPGAVLQGKDPQLDRAIEYLKKKLAEDPVRPVEPPPFPVKTKNRG